MLRIFEGFKIWRHIDIQKFPVDEQKTFRVGQAGKLRKILCLDLSQSCRSDLGHARGFIERKPARQPRFLKFFAKTFDCHRVRRLNGGVKIDKNLARLRTFAGPQNTALFQNINDPRRAGVTEAQPALEK